MNKQYKDIYIAYHSRMRWANPWLKLKHIMGIILNKPMLIQANIPGESIEEYKQR